MIDDKIKKLKDFHLDSAPESRRMLNDWEKDYRRLVVEQSYFEDKLTVKIMNECRRRILEVNQLLAEARDLTDPQRAKIFERKDAYVWFLRMFAKDFEAELKALEAKVDYELEAVDNAP